MSLLCLDVRNSHTGVGLFTGSALVRTWSLSTDNRRTPDEWRLLIGGLLKAAGDPEISGVIVSSAVPAVLHALRALLADPFADVPGLVLGPGVKTGLPVLVDNPREVGTDRIANSVAAMELA